MTCMLLIKNFISTILDIQLNCMFLRRSDKISTISARVWNLLTSVIDVNVSFAQFKVISILYFYVSGLDVFMVAICCNVELVATERS